MKATDVCKEMMLTGKLAKFITDIQSVGVDEKVESWVDVSVRVKIKPDWEDENLIVRIEAYHPKKSGVLLWYQEESISSWPDTATILFDGVFKTKIKLSFT